MENERKARIIEELRGKIGVIAEPMLYQVEKGAIRRFIEAVEDFNPLYWDEEYARKTRYGSVIAPPGFFGLPDGEVIGAGIIPDFGILLTPILNSFPSFIEIVVTGGVNGGTEGTFFRPVRVGDILLTYFKLSDITEKSGKFGPMVFFTFEQTFKNRVNQLVAIMRHVLVVY